MKMTRCIFCKSDSSTSKNIEHIIPESLGNIDFVLDPGIVCDNCNNYFARKVEKPFMEHPGIKKLRSEGSIKSKRKRDVEIDAICGKYPIKVRLLKDEITLVGIEFTDVPPGLIDDISNGKIHSIFYPAFSGIEDLPKESIITRFLGKMGLEEFASRLSTDPETLNDLIDDPATDMIRSHVRYGSKMKWEYNVRILDEIGQLFENEDGDIFEFINELYLLCVDVDGNIRVIVVFYLLGIEFAMCLNDTEIGAYQKWLKENDNRSPLRSGKYKESFDSLRKIKKNC